MTGKKLDLTGKRIHRLTVIKKEEKANNGYFMWLCRCDCGNTLSVDTRRLNRGTIRDCGCERRNRNEDMTGRRFKRLLVKERAASKNGRSQWLCECDCGNEHIVSSHNLKNGHVQSCGCLREETGKYTKRNLLGQTFGRLNVIEDTNKRNNKGSAIWKCICDCGNEVEVSYAQLKSKSVVSCGCKRKEINERVHSQLTFTDKTCIEFLKYRKIRKDNTAGFRGLSKQNGKYKVWIGFRNETYYLGSYEDFEEAKRVRLEAEETVHNQYIRLFEIWKANAEDDPDYEKTNPLIFEVRRENNRMYVESPLLAKTGGEES